MIPVNPGNLLPFYTSKRHQRHRQTGTDVLPYGMPCPNVRLMPFQLFFGSTISDPVTWALVNAQDEGDVTTLDPDLLTIVNKSGGGSWITWNAETFLDQWPDCGYYFLQLYVGDTGYFSEVLHLKYYGVFEVAKLDFSACSESAPNFTFTLTSEFSCFNPSAATVQIDRYNAGWSTLASADHVAVTEAAALESRQYRTVVQTAYGNTITATYTATWDAGDPCGTFALALDSLVVTNSDPSALEPEVMVSFTNTNDKYSVLYQDGYTQRLYLPNPVWDVPVVERNVEVSVNADGNETIRFSRTVERRRFEFADVPDWALGFLTKCGDLDTINVWDLSQNYSYNIQNVQFESRRQGAALNIGVLSFDAEIETFAGCLDDYELV